MKKQLEEKMYKKERQVRLLSRVSLFFFDRSRAAAIIWLFVMLFGLITYTTLHKREGFPSVNIPFSVAQGTYFVNDPAKVDQEVAKPLSEVILKDERVKTVETSSQGSFYNITIQYDEDTNAESAGKDLAKAIDDANVLPDQATLVIEAPKFGFTERGDDAVVTVYANEKGIALEDLVAEGDKLTAFLKEKNIPDMESVSVVDPFVHGTDPASGEVRDMQSKFDRYGERQSGQNVFYDSVPVGMMQKDGTDVIKFDDRLQQVVREYNLQNPDARFTSVVTASYAHDIKLQINELQRALLEGLLAILVIGSIIIAIRASLITVLAMLTVLAISLAVLYLFGLTLNTITLFSLVLCLGLIVDDTIIMVEALDAQRRRRKDARETVEVATRKVSRAMLAATLTAILSFTPLLFVGGILGSFIRSIPITVIIALLTSLLVALVFIPVFARYLLLGKKQMGKENVHEPAAGIEASIANFIAKPMLWARGSTKKLLGVGILAVLVGFSFIAMAGFLFQKVTFNIFPPSKDSNALAIMMNFAPGTTIEEAEKVADRANAIVGETVGKEFRYATHYAIGSAQNAMLFNYITPYDERDIRAPEIVTELEKKFEGFEGAEVKPAQLDVGPPAAQFSVRIVTDDREAALALAKDINEFLLTTELVRPSGEKATIESTLLSDPGVYTRADGNSFVQVSATFDGDDTTTLVTLAEDAVNEEYTAEKLAEFGLPSDVLDYAFGQEEENQESFQTLVYAFPIMLLAIFILLAVQFRSLVQPLLIFMAIPFSLFGITLGLYLTDNAFSFFGMLGFFALIGLSIKNTILLTDYANQLRRSGAGVIDSAVGALSERFRPLIATSLTAVASLIPLAIMSPFWEGLAVVLICGLLSSTFLVIVVFPYYYLGVEFMRLHVSRRAGLTWFGLIVALSAASIALGLSGGIIPWIILGVTVGMIVAARMRRKRQTA